MSLPHPAARPPAPTTPRGRGSAAPARHGLTQTCSGQGTALLRPSSRKAAARFRGELHVSSVAFLVCRKFAVNLRTRRWQFSESMRKWLIHRAFSSQPDREPTAPLPQPLPCSPQRRSFVKHHGRLVLSADASRRRCDGSSGVRYLPWSWRGAFQCGCPVAGSSSA